MALDYNEWMAYGIKNGWCGPPVCYTHDGMPMSEQEDIEFGEGQDPCIHIVRMYEDIDIKNEIESNHSPSQWRNKYETK
jgi:hypothetical protein